MLGTADVFLLYPDSNEIKISCKRCGKFLTSTAGKFMIGLRIIDKGAEFKYFLAADERTICCGEEKITLKTFDTEAEAKVEQARVFKHLENTNSTEGLKLVSAPATGYGNN
jgi:hypothetical protein